MDSSRRSPSCFVPVIPYADVASARDWLQQAFDFECIDRQCSSDDKADAEQLGFVTMKAGTGLLVLAASSSEQVDPHFERCYVVVDDPEAHCVRAVAAGAVVISPPEQKQHGIFYTCRDPRGHVWSFGTFDPRPELPPQNTARSQLQRAAIVCFGLAIVGGALWVQQAANASRAETMMRAVSRQDLEAALLAKAEADRQSSEAQKNLLLVSETTRELEKRIADLQSVADKEVATRTRIESDVAVLRAEKQQHAARVTQLEAELSRVREDWAHDQGTLRQANTEAEANARAAVKQAEELTKTLETEQKRRAAVETDLKIAVGALKAAMAKAERKKKAAAPSLAP